MTLTQSCAITPFDELYSSFKKGASVFDKLRTNEDEQFLKVYNDGGHFVGRLVKNAMVSKKRTAKTEIDNFFDYVYFHGLKNNLKKRELFEFVKTAIIDQYGEFEGLNTFIEKKIKIKISNFYKRLKLFRRKARMNKWNKFVTITYDDKKHDANSFKTKLKKCLANFHTRRGWKYMGVFEHAPDTGRLHFHAIMFIPENEMVGIIEEKQDYSTAQHKMQTTLSNSFFAETFGRNDFQDLSKEEIKSGKALDYITKYLSKTNERIVYSRDIPSEILLKVHFKDIATTMFDFVLKFILFDDVVDYDRDVLKCKFDYKQRSIFDYGLA